jgi:hypothetical protein
MLDGFSEMRQTTLHVFRQCGKYRGMASVIQAGRHASQQKNMIA